MVGAIKVVAVPRPGGAALSGPLKNYDIVSLRVFLAAVEEGNLGKAADTQNIAISAASKRIKDLELRAGVELLSRHSRGVSPTPAGAALAQHARNLIELIQRMDGELGNFANGARGLIRISANRSSLVLRLAADLRQFLGQHPGIHIAMREDLSGNVLTAVRDGAADLGVYDSILPTPSGLMAWPYASDRLVCVAPARHELASMAAVTLSDLLEYELIAPEQGSSVEGLIDAKARAMGAELKMSLRVSTADIILTLVATGYGLAILPEAFLLGSPDPRVTAIPLLESWASRTLNLCVRSDQDLPALRPLVAYLRNTTK